MRLLLLALLMACSGCVDAPPQIGAAAGTYEGVWRGEATGKLTTPTTPAK